MPKKAATKKATAASSSKRKKPEDDEVEEKEEKVDKKEESNKKRKVAVSKGKGGKKKKEEEVEEEEEEEKVEEKKGDKKGKKADKKGDKKEEAKKEEKKDDGKAKPKGKGKGKAKKDEDEDEEMEEEEEKEEKEEKKEDKEEKAEGAVHAVLDKRVTEEEGTEYLVSYGKNKPTDWIKVTEGEIPVPLIRAFETENKEKVWKKIDALNDVTSSEKLVYTHKCCIYCAFYGVYSAAQNGDLGAIKVHVANFPEILSTSSTEITNALAIAMEKNYLPVVDYFLSTNFVGINPTVDEETTAQKRNEVKFPATIPRELTPECLKLLYKIKGLDLGLLARDLYSKGNRLALASVLTTLKEQEEKLSKPKNNITDLHIAVLTKSKASDLPKPLNYDTIHANALAHHVTPLHLAALNPNPEIVKALVDAGGDLTYADDYSHIPAFYSVISDVHGSDQALQEDEFDDDMEEDEKINEQEREIERVSSWSAVLIRQRLKDLDIDTKGTKEVLLERLIAAIKKGKAILFDYKKIVDEEEREQHKGPKYPKGTSKTFKWMLENHGFGPGPVAELGYIFRSFYDRAMEHDSYAHAQVILRIANMPYNTKALAGDKMLAIQLKKQTFALQTSATRIEHALNHAISQRNVANVRRLLAVFGGGELKIEYVEKAIEHRSLSIVELFVNEYKLPVNDNALYRSLLHTAVSNGFLDAAKLLIEKGANINEITDNGETVLMSAARARHPACIQLLVEKGVNVNPKKDEKEKGKEKEVEKEEDEDAINFAVPVFNNMVFIISGAFSRSMSYYYHVLKSNGASCPSSVTKNITHLLLGATAQTEYGGITGKGSKKYREAMAKKPKVVTEEWVNEQVEKRNAAYRRKYGTGEPDVTGNILHDLFQHSLNSGNHVGLGDTVEYLVNIGVDLNVLDNASRTVLHSFILYIAATSHDGVEALKVLLKHTSKDPKYINRKDKLGFNAVLLAAALGKHAFLEILIQQKGVELNEIIPFPPPLTQQQKEAKQKKAADKQQRWQARNSRYSYSNSHNSSNNGYQVRKGVVKGIKRSCCGLSLMQITCKSPNVLKKVVAAGGDPNINSVNEKGAQMPLACYAANSQHMEALEYLVSSPEVNVNAREEETGNTLLHYLASSAHVGRFDTIVEKRKGTAFDLSVVNKNGYTLLHSALTRYTHAPAMIRYLVKLLKVNQEVLDSVFRLALSLNFHEACMFFLDSGANIQQLEYIIKNKTGVASHVFFHVMHSPKLNPIDACTSSIAAGDNTLALQFVEDPKVKESLTAPVCASLLRSLLVHATAHLQELKDTQALIGKLLSYHPPADIIKEQDSEGNTSLHLAIKNKSHTTIIQSLLDAIAGKQNLVVPIANKKGQNCIHTAITYRDAVVLAMVLKSNNAGVNAVDGSGKTPLHLVLTESPWGIFIGSTKFVEVLMKGGADIFLAPKDSPFGSAISIASSYPPALSKPLATALINVVRATNEAKAAKIIEEKITAAFDEGNKTRVAAEKSKKVGKDKKRAERKKKMDQLAAIKAKSSAEEKKSLQRQSSTQVMAPLASDKLNIPALGGGGDYEVLREGDEIFDTTLISTDIDYNIFGSNKYYHMQLQEYKGQPKVTMKGKVLPSTEAPYRIFISTARIGDYSPVEEIHKYYKVEEGRSSFKDIFYSKTHNNWAKRDEFEKVKGAWNMMKKVYDVVIDEETRKKDYELSKLPVSVKSLLYQITDLSLLRRTMEEAGIDWRMMPLGRLDKSQLKDGHDILRHLEQAITRIQEIHHMRGRKQAECQKELKKLQSTLTEQSNEFYMRIPHNFYGGPNSNHWGYARPDVINDMSKVKQKVLMLESLREVGAALELLYAPPAYVPGKGSLLDGIYDSLCVDISEVALDSAQAQLLKKYVHNTAPNIGLTNIFKVSRWAEKESFEPWKEYRNTPTAEGLPSNTLLFHGTKATNVLGILSQGLKIAPPEAPTTGYMFGKGVYAANTFIKSQGYCDSHTDHYLMFVCEVCVGETYNCTYSDPIEKLPDGKRSTWGQGHNTPDPAKLLVTPKGVSVPLGSLTNNNGHYALNYDEFIVYDASQVQLKYILKFKTNQQ